MQNVQHSSVNLSPVSPLDFLARAGEVYPEKTAIIYGKRSHSYTEFVARTEALARAIRAEIQPGDRVAFLAPNIPELLIAHFAVPLAGGVLVAINTRLGTGEVTEILRHSGAALLFVDAELARQHGADWRRSTVVATTIEIADPEFGLERSGLGVGELDYAAFVARHSGSGGDLEWGVADELGLISLNYTSGTTGAPKGVMYTHRGAYLNAIGEMHHNAFDADTVYLWTLPLFHCNGWCGPWAVTAAGGTHVCLREVRAEHIWDAIDSLGISHLSGAPTVCSTIVNAKMAHAVQTPLRITTAGAPPTPAVLAQLESLDIEVVHAYGLTETYGPITVCEHQPGWAQLSPAERARMVSRQGVAMVQANRARVVTEDMADVVADGETLGEIVFRGNTVMLGYFNDPEATAAAFAGGWFHTGDLGVMHPDGYIEIKDRAKDIIISGGENISSVEVENAMSGHPAVHDIAVVGYPHEHWGERPKAYVLVKPGTQATETELLEFARGVLAKYKVPDYVVFVEQLPRTATGKVTKGALRALADRPAPVSNAS